MGLELFFAWLGGVGIGVAITTLVFNYLANREHEAWSSLCDRYDAVATEALKRLEKCEKRDPADWWRGDWTEPDESTTE